MNYEVIDVVNNHYIASDEWQAIGAWAWGSSRIVDFLETQKEISGTDKYQ